MVALYELDVGHVRDGVCILQSMLDQTKRE